MKNETGHKHSRKSSKGLKILNEIEYQEFYMWLRLGLERYYFLDERQEAFDSDKMNFIGRNEHITLDLRDIYKTLEPKAQMHFRKSVKLLFSWLPTEEKYLPIFSALLALAQLLPVYEILWVIPGKVGKGSFGDERSEEGRMIFSDTMEVLAYLAIARDEDLEACLDSLIKSVNFVPSYVDTALIAYCRLDDKNLANHLEKTRKYFYRLYADDKNLLKDNPDLVYEIYDLVFDICDEIGIENILASFKHMKIIDPKTNDYNLPTLIEQVSKGAIEENDNWLVYSLFANPDVPIKIVDDLTAENILNNTYEFEYVIQYVDQQGNKQEMTANSICHELNDETVKILYKLWYIFAEKEELSETQMNSNREYLQAAEFLKVGA